MLQMTDEQRYSAVLKELGEVLQEKNTTISCQQWQIDQLKAKLEEAEKERDDWHEGWRAAADQRDDALIELKELKEGLKKEREASGVATEGETCDTFDGIISPDEVRALHDATKRHICVEGGAV